MMSNLVRWEDPFLTMERFMDDFMRPMARTPGWNFPSLWETPFPGDNLAIDMYETDDALYVEAAMPGVRPEEIEIEEHDGLLTIRAQHKEESAYEKGRWQVRERYAGAWQRTMRLPVEVKGKKAEAVLEDGVLHITLPKAHPGKRKVNRIQVKLPKFNLPKLGKREKRIKVK